MGVSRGLGTHRACTVGVQPPRGRPRRVPQQGGAGEPWVAAVLGGKGGKAGVWACCHRQSTPLAGQEEGPGCRRGGGGHSEQLVVWGGLMKM